MDLSSRAKYNIEKDLTVWYKWTAPPVVKWARIDVSGIEVPCVLSVYTGSIIDELTKVGLNRRKLTTISNRLIFPVTPGVTYQIRVAVQVEDYLYDQMPGLDFTLGIKMLNNPLSSEDYIFRGRGELAKGTSDGLVKAMADFDKAVQRDQNNQEAKLLYALTNLLNLENEPGFAQLLIDLGLTKNEGFQMGGVIQANKDVNGFYSPPVGAMSGLAIEWIDDRFLTRIASIRTHLSQITDDSFLTDLTEKESGGAEIIIDKGDVMLLKAVTHGVDMIFDFILTYDLDVSLETLASLNRDGHLNAEQTLNAFSSLLQFAATDRRQEFKQSIESLNSDFILASDFIKGREGESVGLMSRELWTHPETDSEVRSELSNIISSLHGESLYGNGSGVNLSKLVETNMSMRYFLPEFRGDQVVPNTFVDSTFDGLYAKPLNNELHSMVYKLGSLWGMSQYVEDMRILAGLLPEDTWYDPESPYEDSDGDGTNNFNEWVRGTEPFIRDVVWQDLSRTVISPNHVNFELSFVRRKALANWKLQVWVSDDLISWDQTEAQINMVGSPQDNGDGYSETVIYRLTNASALGNQKFLRVIAVPK